MRNVNPLKFCTGPFMSKQAMAIVLVPTSWLPQHCGSNGVSSTMSYSIGIVREPHLANWYTAGPPCRT